MLFYYLHARQEAVAQLGAAPGRDVQHVLQQVRVGQDVDVVRRLGPAPARGAGRRSRAGARRSACCSTAAALQKTLLASRRPEQLTATAGGHSHRRALAGLGCREAATLAIATAQSTCSTPKSPERLGTACDAALLRKCVARTAHA